MISRKYTPYLAYLREIVIVKFCVLRKNAFIIPMIIPHDSSDDRNSHFVLCPLGFSRSWTLIMDAGY